jgi:hypothetical protein
MTVLAIDPGNEQSAYVRPAFLDPRLPGRFWDKCLPEPNSGCWLWTGSLHRLGYGEVWFQGRRRHAHRVAYLTLVGDDDHKGLELDHICRTRCCVNPTHLEPVTHRENMRRSHSFSSTKTTCPAGHVYDVNYTRNGTARRACRLCRNRAQREYMARRRGDRALEVTAS